MTLLVFSTICESRSTTVNTPEFLKAVCETASLDSASAARNLEVLQNEKMAKNQALMMIKLLQELPRSFISISIANVGKLDVNLL